MEFDDEKQKNEHDLDENLATNFIAYDDQLSKTATSMDRLSNLPDCILHHILSYMNATYCVRTSVLSKRWNRVWASLPVIKFEGLYFNPRPTRRREYFRDLVLGFLNGRDHHAPINYLGLDLSGAYDLDSHEYDLDENFATNFLAYVDSHDIQHLAMVFSPSHKKMPAEAFPKTLFPCQLQSVKTLDLKYYDHHCPSNLELSPSPAAQTLTTLRLHHCGFWGGNSLDPFASFVNLKELYLHSCRFDHLGITFKITAPQLVRLDINLFKHVCMRWGFDDSLKLEIWAPKLQSFRCYLNCPIHLSSLHLPVLENLEIKFMHASSMSHYTYFKSLEFLMNMFEGFHHAQSVKICANTIVLLRLAKPAALERRPFPFTRLKTLTIMDRDDNIPANVMAYFLRTALWHQ
ncbi:hypothetical protein COLO4_11203 [Corchorus olitorius]|uniref:F-box domain-containing protein n=1 Tax=Corchorus olitorius TaxID=93759 RepID=A0A1R3K5D9_9ROSI|nr:hypothetical protein COLO4_11203 [Corchorus olitorius]